MLRLAALAQDDSSFSVLTSDSVHEQRLEARVWLQRFAAG